MLSVVLERKQRVLFGIAEMHYMQSGLLEELLEPKLEPKSK